MQFVRIYKSDLINTDFLSRIDGGRVFSPEKALKKYNCTFDWRSEKQGLKMDDELEQRVEHYWQQGGGGR